MICSNGSYTSSAAPTNCGANPLQSLGVGIQEFQHALIDFEPMIRAVETVRLIGFDQPFHLLAVLLQRGAIESSWQALVPRV